MRITGVREGNGDEVYIEYKSGMIKLQRVEYRHTSLRRVGTSGEAALNSDRAAFGVLIA